MRYKLSDLINFGDFADVIDTELHDFGYPMGVDDDETIEFIGSAVYGYFYDDLVAYSADTKVEVNRQFLNRLVYDIWVKLPYWNVKYQQIKKLLTTDDISLMQTSKVTSSSSDNTDSASGSLQKIATTPTGVSVDSATDGFEISIDDGDNSVATAGFVDKYTNTQQKYASSNKIVGTRSGEILREGSIEDLVNVLEKLPSSFADEVTKALGHHFIFDYDGDEKGLYNETN